MNPNSRSKNRYMAEINVTPLVDVVLVLLIIFMVTAPMLTKGLDVKLPETTAKALPQQEKNLVISINEKGEIFLNKIPLDKKMLLHNLAVLKKEGRIKQILLRADKNVPYGKVAQVVATVREAGITDLGLVTKPVEKAEKQ